MVNFLSHNDPLDRHSSFLRIATSKKFIGNSPEKYTKSSHARAHDIPLKFVLISLIPESALKSHVVLNKLLPGVQPSCTGVRSDVNDSGLREICKGTRALCDAAKTLTLSIDPRRKAREQRRRYFKIHDLCGMKKRCKSEIQRRKS